MGAAPFFPFGAKPGWPVGAAGLSAPGLTAASGTLLDNPDSLEQPAESKPSPRDSAIRRPIRFRKECTSWNPELCEPQGSHRRVVGRMSHHSMTTSKRNKEVP